MEITEELEQFIRDRYNQVFDPVDFEEHLDEYLGLKDFAPNGNIFDDQYIQDETHFIMRMATQYHLTEAFKAMKMDLTDANVSENLESGNIGTPGRIAKVWCGFDTNDDRELGSGRWSSNPRLADFPSEVKEKIISNIPITKRVDLVSNCSHHFIPFHTKARQDSYAIISYIPTDFKLGISKLQRITDFISQRFWLQEDLTDALYYEVSKAAKTDDVYVGLFNVVHGCENLRGAKSGDGAFTSEAYGGKFESYELRQQVTKH